MFRNCDVFRWALGTFDKSALCFEMLEKGTCSRGKSCPWDPSQEAIETARANKGKGKGAGGGASGRLVVASGAVDARVRGSAGAQA